MQKLRIATIIGSNRRESLNHMLARALTILAPKEASFDFIRIDDVPMFNQDLEADLPPSVLRFKAEIAAADGLLFVTPEHNRSIPALLKNAIDWGTRPFGQNCWAGKSAAIMGTSPGSLGTALAQSHLRQILGSLNVLVMGGEAYISFKPGLIDVEGTVTDERTRRFLEAFIDQFTLFVPRWSVPAAAA